MEKKKFPVFIASGAVLLVLAGAVGIKYFTNSSGGEQMWGSMPPTPVTTTQVQTHIFEEAVEAIGTARANESVDIMAKVTDTVHSIGFEDAEVAVENQILVELTDIEEMAGLAEARASLSEATKEYARTKELVENGTASASRLDGIMSSRDRARAKVQALEAKLADRIIRAPFAGVLGLRHVSVGSLVRPGDLITTLDDVSIIKIDFSVPERYLATVGSGQSVHATNVAYPGRAFEGTVKSVDSRIDPVTRAVTVRAHLPNEDRALRPGMLLSLTLVMSSTKSLAVPESSIIPVKDEVFVYVVGEESTAEKRTIKTGMRSGGQIEVLSGLEAGEEVIVEGTSRIRRPGQKVRTGDAPPNKGPGEGKRDKTAKAWQRGKS